MSSSAYHRVLANALVLPEEEVRDLVIALEEELERRDITDDRARQGLGIPNESERE